VGNPFRPDIPPHVADIIRSLHSDLKRSIKSAVQAIAADPGCGEPLRRELEGLWKYRVRRFRIVYATDRKTRTVRLMAVGHRQNVYEELAARMKSEKKDGKKGIEKGGISRSKRKREEE
jgi:mRNA interferase RelE/StbE